MTVLPQMPLVNILILNTLSKLWSVPYYTFSPHKFILGQLEQDVPSNCISKYCATRTIKVRTGSAERNV